MARSKILVLLAALALVVAAGSHGRAQAPAVQAPPPQSGPAPVRVGGNIRAPRKIRDVRPVYPEEALANRIQGIVIVEATIGIDGKVTGARVIRSVPRLDQAALDAVRQWEFEPTMVNGVATPIVMTVTVNFSLGVAAPGTPAAAPAAVPAPAAETPDCASPLQLPPGRTPRRDAAIQFMEDVNEKERLTLIESQAKEYVPPSDLPGRPEPPAGFQVQFVSQGSTYALSAIDTRDVCGFGLFSDQRGVVYIGVPVPARTGRAGIR